MLAVGFESTIAAGKRPKTYALDRAATGTDKPPQYWCLISIGLCSFYYLII